MECPVFSVIVDLHQNSAPRTEETCLKVTGAWHLVNRSYVRSVHENHPPVARSSHDLTASVGTRTAMRTLPNTVIRCPSLTLGTSNKCKRPGRSLGSRPRNARCRWFVLCSRSWIHPFSLEAK